MCRFPMRAGVCGAIKNDLVYNNEGLTITPPCRAMVVVYRQVTITIFRMPIYPMLNQCQ